MADGDLIYVPTKSNGLGYKLGGSALAYKATPQYGKRVIWDGGDLYNSHAVLYIEGTQPTGAELIFTSPTDVVDGTWYNTGTNWAMYALTIPGLPGYDSNSRLELQWVNATRCEVRVYLNASDQAQHSKSPTSYSIPSPYEGGSIDTGYNYLAGVDLGNVEVQAIP